MSDFSQAWTPNGRVSPGGRWVLVIGTVGIFIASWTMRPVFLPGPADVMRAYPNLMDQGLAAQLLVSFSTNFQAILISCATTLPLAYLTVLPAIRPLVQGLCKTRLLSMIGFTIPFTIVFGGGHALKIALLVFGMNAFLITSLYDIVESIPREEFDHARTLRMGAWGSVLEVVVFGHLDVVLDAIRQNAAMGWMMLTMVEGLVRFEGGLGSMMLAEDKHIRLEAVFAIQIVVLLIGIGQDWALAALKRVLCPYSNLTLERQ